LYAYIGARGSGGVMAEMIRLLLLHHDSPYAEPRA
jgi:hypothetical protein